MKDEKHCALTINKEKDLIEESLQTFGQYEEGFLEQDSSPLTAEIFYISETGLITVEFSEFIQTI